MGEVGRPAIFGEPMHSIHLRIPDAAKEAWDLFTAARGEQRSVVIRAVLLRGWIATARDLVGAPDPDAGCGEGEGET